MARPRRLKPARRNPASAKRVLIGIGALLALAAASYGVHYFLVGRFLSRPTTPMCAPTTTLGARVSGHVAAIMPGDNAGGRAGDVVFKIDDGDYRIAVDAARTKIATQQATIDRVGRQVAAQESAVRAGQGAARVRRSRPEAGRARLRPSAGAEQQGLCLACDL
jgi:membrane fusion protein (multidrug efflux system)